jgi:hypothetical protein
MFLLIFPHLPICSNSLLNETWFIFGGEDMRTGAGLIILLLVTSTAFANPWPYEGPLSGGYGYVGAGGDYQIDPGGSITFTGGYNPAGIVPSVDAASWQWYVDTVNMGSGGGGGGFPSPVDTFSQNLSYDDLINLGLAPGQHTVMLSVQVAWHYPFDPYLQMGEQTWYGSDTAALNIVPEPATMSLLGLGVIGLLRNRSKA